MQNERAYIKAPFIDQILIYSASLLNPVLDIPAKSLGPSKPASDGLTAVQVQDGSLQQDNGAARLGQAHARMVGPLARMQFSFDHEYRCVAGAPIKYTPRFNLGVAVAVPLMLVAPIVLLVNFIGFVTMAIALSSEDRQVCWFLRRRTA